MFDTLLPKLPLLEISLEEKFRALSMSEFSSDTMRDSFREKRLMLVFNTVLRDLKLRVEIELIYETDESIFTGFNESISSIYSLHTLESTSQSSF
jgi:hypothetical protein